MALMLLAVATASMMQSCKEDKLAGPDSSELYARDFLKHFGVPDPNHSYNMAVEGTVSVTTARSTDVKVYANVMGRRYLFADYRGINGTKEISIDLPRDIKSVIVRANGIDYTVPVGGAIDLSNPKSKSRLMTEDGVTPDNILSWHSTRRNMFRSEALTQFIEQYPEETPNLGRGTTSFYFISDGEEHTFYPFYWDTRACHILGIYYIPDPSKPDDIVMQDLYFTKTENVLYISIAEDAAPTVEECDYKVGDVHSYNAYRYTTTEWAEVFPGFRNVDENKNSTQLDYLKNEDGSDRFPLGQLFTFTEANAEFVTDNGYISSIEFHAYAFEITETVTKPYHSTFTATANHFNSVGDSQTAYIPYSVQENGSTEGSRYVYTRGITYQIEKGVRYGFYIKVNDSGSLNAFSTENDDKTRTPKALEDQDYDYIIFSQASRNKSFGADTGENETIRGTDWSKKTWWNGDFTESDKYAYAAWGSATLGGVEYSLFAFEDWAASTNNVGADLNDLMFMFAAGDEPEDKTIIDEEKEPTEPEDDVWFPWILAAEDLGQVQCDWDFNDMVACVRTCVVYDEADEDKANPLYTRVQVAPMAAGGTLPIYMMWTGTLLDDTTEGHYLLGGQEFHGWLRSGLDPGSPYKNGNSTGIINVQRGSTAEFNLDNCVEFKVAGKFSVSRHQQYGNHDEYANNMGGFWFIVDRKGEMSHYHSNTSGLVSIPTLPADSEITTIKAPSKDFDAPQMICVEYGWYWPYEGKPIDEAYPAFVNWISDPSVKWCHEDHSENGDIAGGSKHTSGSVITYSL